jgi:hypothetical protein
MWRVRMKITGILLLVFVFISTCNISFAVDAAKPAFGPPTKEVRNEPTEGEKLYGMVLIALNKGGYTYIRYQSTVPTKSYDDRITFILGDINGDETWIAVPETRIKVGDIISFKYFMPLTNFKSAPLKKTFKKISFVPGLEIILMPNN